MAKLSKAERDNLPGSAFLGPGRSFPGNDKTHLEKAIQLAPRSEHAGNISPATEKSIVSKAKARLGEKDGGDMKKDDGKKAMPFGGKMAPPFGKGGMKDDKPKGEKSKEMPTKTAAPKPNRFGETKRPMKKSTERGYEEGRR